MDLDSLSTCPYCAHSNASIYRADQKYRESSEFRDIVRCNECHTIYPRPRMVLQKIQPYLDELATKTSRERYLSGYDRYLKKNQARYTREQIRALGLHGGRALDIGCSIGIQCEIMKSVGLEVYGLDPDAFAGSIAKEKGHNVSIGYFPDDAALVEQKGPFDLITSFECIYYFPDFKKALQTVHRMLKPGGVFFIQSHVGTSHYYGRASTMFARYSDYVQAIPSAESFRYCLRASGFEVESIKKFPEDFFWNHFGRTFPRRMRWLERALDRVVVKFLNLETADRLVIVARKI
jgi:2-polyprenyl-3-methyl-5-hydroxy-6-metoxy-1,4-benzoquinol methylase